MDSKDSILKFFYTDNPKPIIHLIEITKLIFFQINNNTEAEDIIKDIFSILKIDKTINEFLKDLEEILKLKVDKEKVEFKKKNDGFKETSFFRVYNALFWQLKVKNKDIFTQKVKPQILISILKYHLNFLLLQNITDEEKDFQYSNEYFENVSLCITRSIEFLINLSLLNDNSINEVYFNDDNEDLIENFINVISDNNHENVSFYIVKKKDKIQLCYENQKDSNLKFIFTSSRRVNFGSNTGEKNNNIITYLKDVLPAYIKIKNHVHKLKPKSEPKRKKSNHNLELEVKKEPLLKNVTVFEKKGDMSNYSIEDKIETLSNPIISIRCNKMIDDDSDEIIYDQNQELINIRNKFLSLLKQIIEKKIIAESSSQPKQNNEKKIPNSLEQLRQNLAYSLEITKNRLMLSNNYNIPEINNYKAFIKHVAYDFNSLEGDEKIYTTIFLISVLTGFTFKECIEVFFLDNSHYNPESGIISMSLLSKTIFPIENDFFQKANEKINYLLPINFINLIFKYRKILFLNKNSNSCPWQNGMKEKNYKDYIKSKILSYEKRIVFDYENTWCFLVSYVRSLKKEDITTLFCLGKKLKNDDSKLAYGSSAKDSLIYSKFLSEISFKLGLDSILNELNLESKLKKTIITADINVRAGSNRIPNLLLSKKFFDKMKKYCNHSKYNKIQRFNILSIYTRIALGILLGTRTNDYSCSLQKISFSTHVLSISEKSTTLLSGTRIIPLCSKAEEIIKNYQKYAKELNIPLDNIYLIDQQTNKIQIYKNKLAVDIAEKLELENNIIEFVKLVPLNIGRHIISKYGIEHNFNQHYIDAFLGHYVAGAEQFGTYSTLNMKKYIDKMRTLLQNISNIYGIY